MSGRLASSDVPISASQSAGITGVSHCAQPHLTPLIRRLCLCSALSKFLSVPIVSVFISFFCYLDSGPSSHLSPQDSSGLRLWKRRWFVLSGHCLFYYKGQWLADWLGWEGPPAALLSSLLAS